MSASYQCPNCGQVVPVIELDETGPVRCPSCQGAMRSGPPPAPLPPPAADAHIVQPISPWHVEPSVPARWDDEDSAEIDIRRREIRPAPPARATQSSGRGKHVVWPLIVAGIALLRLLSHANHHDHPQVPQVNVPQMQFQVPNAGGPDQPGLLQRATWSERVPDTMRVSRLLLSGPINPRIGVVADDRDAGEATFTGFDGNTGGHAGRIVWKAPVHPLAFSLSDDGSRLAVLLHDGRKATQQFQIYALPGGNPVGAEWYPFPQAANNLVGADAGADDVWFEMLGPDRLLTIFQQRKLELWSMPDGKRLYSIELERAPDDNGWAAAIGPDRRVVAIANRTRGFTFHDTANGAILGKTTAVPDRFTKRTNCAFSPDGKHLGCQRTAADPPEEKWLMWSCPDGAIEAQWNRTMIARWLFWDDDRVLVDDWREWELLEAPNGKTLGMVDKDNDEVFHVASTGRRLWYTSRARFALVQLVSIELQPQWFQNPVPNDGLLRRWSLKPEGFSNRR